MLLLLVALAGLASAGATWWRRTTVVREYDVETLTEGVPDMVWREYADGRVEAVPRAE
jgi:hypothetical protein